MLGCGLSAATDSPGLYIAPYLQNVAPDGITVMWETTDPVAGTVEYGRNGSFDRQAGESGRNKIHEVRISGLEPGETYDYRVRYGQTTLPAASFTTAPPPGSENWRFVVYGDNRSNPDTHARNAGQIMKLKPGIILNTGDLVAQGSSYEQWKPQYFDPLRGVSEHIPVFPCLGNHEQNAPHYYKYHSLPGDQGEVYYSFDYANAHIISLNSNAKDAPYQRGEKQTEWLIEDLKKHKDATWKIVFFHHPLFRSHPTRGITAQRWVWQPLFEEYGVDLVLNGHDHYYMRSYAVGRYTGEPRPRPVPSNFRRRRREHLPHRAQAARCLPPPRSSCDSSGRDGRPLDRAGRGHRRKCLRRVCCRQAGGQLARGIHRLRGVRAGTRPWPEDPRDAAGRCR